MGDNPLTLVQTLVPAVSGLLGVGIGAWINARITDKRERLKQRHEFLSKQLAELYGPLVALRQELLARTALRDRIIDTTTDVREKITEEARQVSREEVRRVIKEEHPPYDAVANDMNKVFVEMLLPTYRSMRDLYREKLWLAEPETRDHFGRLLDFVEIWERYAAKQLPLRVVYELELDARKLNPVFEHLEGVHERLRKDLGRA